MSLVQPQVIAEYKDSKNNVFRVYAYSFDSGTRNVKSIAVTLPEEEGKAFSGSFTKLNGKCNAKLKVGKAWIFSAKEVETIKKLVGEIASGVAKPEAKVYRRYTSAEPTQYASAQPSINADTTSFGTGTFQSLNQLEQMIMSKLPAQPIQSTVDGRVVLLLVGTITESEIEAKKHSGEKDFRVQLVMNTNDEKNNMYVTYMSWKAPEMIQLNHRRVINLTLPSSTAETAIPPVVIPPVASSSSIETGTIVPVTAGTITAVPAEAIPASQ